VWGAGRRRSGRVSAVRRTRARSRGEEGVRERVGCRVSAGIRSLRRVTVSCCGFACASGQLGSSRGYLRSVTWGNRQRCPWGCGQTLKSGAPEGRAVQGGLPSGASNRSDWFDLWLSLVDSPASRNRWLLYKSLGRNRLTARARGEGVCRKMISTCQHSFRGGYI